MTDSTRSLRAALLTIALLAASLLAFQVLLTRVCALRMHFHFGFLIISNSLLGIGASGSVLALFERTFRLLPEQWITRFSILYLVSLPLSWWYLITASVPDQLRFTDDAGAVMWGQTLQFVGFNLACAVPFFCGGLAVGLLLTANAWRVHAVYAADLVGAGIGCLLCPLLLWDVGAGGCFLATVVLALAACAASSSQGPVLNTALLLCAAGAGLWMQSFDTQFPVPGKQHLDLTNKQRFAADVKSLYSRWSANSRIDVLPVPRGPGTPLTEKGFLQARGDAVVDTVLPPQLWIAQDGDAGTMLTDFASQPEKLEVLRQSMYSTSFQLKQAPDAKFCIIGVGGAPDLWAAKIHDAALIRGIELNEGILEVHRTVARAYSGPLLDDPRVELVHAEGRNALMRSDERYDVVQLTGIDTWTALNSGAYVLAENYLYTVQACETMLARLEDDGVLQITRMAAGMETIRLMNNMLHGLPEDRRGAFADSVAAFRVSSDGLICVALKKNGYAAAEVAQLRKWATEAQIVPVYLPDAEGRARVEADKAALQAADARIKALQAEIDRRTAGIDDKEIERLRGEQAAVRDSLHWLTVHYEVGQFIVSPDKDEFVANYQFDVSPTTDDRPYFFSFVRWDDPERAAEMFHQPTSMVQGNPLFLRNQLLLSGVAALIFIFVPLLFRRAAAPGERPRYGALRFLIYFAGLGIGFIGIEIALIQKFTLLLGLPLYSIVVTLCAILICTGIGAFLSLRVIGDRLERGRFVAVGIIVTALLLAVVSPLLVGACIGLPLWARAGVVVLMIAPIGVLLGMPFAHGVRVIEYTNPGFVPWAWAVNGCMTVIGSILTVILSMNFGFAAVLAGSGLVYVVAFAALDTLARTDPNAVPVEEEYYEEPAGEYVEEAGEGEYQYEDEVQLEGDGDPGDFLELEEGIEPR